MQQFGSRFIAAKLGASLIKTKDTEGQTDDAEGNAFALDLDAFKHTVRECVFAMIGADAAR